MNEVIFGTSKKVIITMEGGGNTETVGEGILFIRAISGGYQFDLREDPGIMESIFTKGSERLIPHGNTKMKCWDWRPERS